MLLIDCCILRCIQGFAFGYEFAYILEAHWTSVLGCLDQLSLESTHLIHDVLLIVLVVCDLSLRVLHHCLNGWIGICYCTIGILPLALWSCELLQVRENLIVLSATSITDVYLEFRRDRCLNRLVVSQLALFL